MYGVLGFWGFFYGRVFSQNETYFYQTTGAPGIKFNQDFLTFKAQILYKHTVNKYFDTQLGLSHHLSQGYFLDMYTDVKNRQYDNFTVLFVGFVFKFRESKNNVRNTGGSRSTSPIKLRCPSF